MLELIHLKFSCVSLGFGMLLWDKLFWRHLSIFCKVFVHVIRNLFPILIPIKAFFLSLPLKLIHLLFQSLTVMIWKWLTKLRHSFIYIFFICYILFIIRHHCLFACNFLLLTGQKLSCYLHRLVDEVSVLVLLHLALSLLLIVVQNCLIEHLLQPLQFLLHIIKSRWFRFLIGLSKPCLRFLCTSSALILIPEHTKVPTREHNIFLSFYT